MNLPTELFGNVLVVHTPDELLAEQSERFAAYLDGLGQGQIVLDMDSTEAIDSDGLTAILSAQDKLRESQGDLRVATTNAVGRKILEITRLDQQLEVFENVVDAVNSFR